MSRVSTFAGSSFSPDRMLRSTTAPVSRFLNFVRVNAAPLPGFTNWNSMTVNGFPSISTFRPLRISDVSYIAGTFTPRPHGLSNLDRRRSRAAPGPAGFAIQVLAEPPPVGDKDRDGCYGA